MRHLDEKERQFISRKKQIELRYARPYMPHCMNPDLETEEQLRSRVREGLQYLSDEERADMMQDKHRVYYEIFTPSYQTSPNKNMGGIPHE